MSRPASDNTADLMKWVTYPPAPRFTGITDPETTRDVRRLLQDVIPLNQGHKPGYWGFAVVRTAYGSGSDERFQHALGLIRRVANVYNDSEVANVVHDLEWVRSDGPIHLEDFPLDVDRSLNDEFERRYHVDALEDREQLDGADAAAVRAFFNEWTERMGVTKKFADLRFAACILLDEETLEQLKDVPEEYPPADDEFFGVNSPYWVKMVEALEPNPSQPFRVRIFGEYGLQNYYFMRRQTMNPIIEMLNDSDPNDPSILYYGEARQHVPTEVVLNLPGFPGM